MARWAWVAGRSLGGFWHGLGGSGCGAGFVALTARWRARAGGAGKRKPRFVGGAFGAGAVRLSRYLDEVIRGGSFQRGIDFGEVCLQRLAVDIGANTAQ